MADLTEVTRQRLRISLHGQVQGMGFRPTVYRIADSLRLSGWVCDTPDGMEIEVEGVADRLDKFRTLLLENRPQAAVVSSAEVLHISPTGTVGFEILTCPVPSSAPLFLHGERDDTVID